MRSTIRVIVGFVVGVLAGPSGAIAEDAGWPSLQEQLNKDRVKPGSALEGLIRQNQEFWMLPRGCGEDLAPWLRVLFHKNHPDVAPAAKCPEAGYPDFLELIYSWMLIHQDLQPGQPKQLQAAPKTATVGSNRRVSGPHPGDPRSESDIRINPWNPARVVAACNDLYSPGAAQQAQFFSTDQGVSWGESFLPLQVGDSFQADPAVDWTSDGTAWSSTLGINAGATAAKVELFKSTDGGANWVFDSIPPLADFLLADKDMLWVDHSNSSPFKNNIYVVWSRGGGIFFNRKAGPSGPWLAVSVDVGSDNGTGGTNGSDIKTNTSGDVLAFYPRFGSKTLFVAKSTDGGANFSPAVAIASTFGGQGIAVPAAPGPLHGGTILTVSGAAFRSITRNAVYAVWRDLSGETGCTTPADAPGSNVLSTCKTRIWFTRSLDGGASWEQARMINNQAGKNDQFNPHLTVDDVSGMLSVVYYDTVGDIGRKKTDLWYQSSYNSGVTWGAPLRVTTVQSDETVSGANGYAYGDYNGLSGLGASLLPSWTDRRSGVEEIWTATVSDSLPVGPPVDTVGVVKVKPEAVGDFKLSIDNQTGTTYLLADVRDANNLKIVGLPITGDWNGDGTDWIGVYAQAASTFYLRDWGAGKAQITFTFGTPGANWKPVAGDWDNDGDDTAGLYDPATGAFYLRNSNSTGAADVTFVFSGAAASWLPLAGDWNGDGVSTVGLYDPATSTFYLKNSNATGGADLTFVFGAPGAGLLPNRGDWDGNGSDTVGVFNPLTGLHQLRNQNGPGSPDYQFTFTGEKPQPVGGNWDGV